MDLMIPKVSGMGVMQHIRGKSFVPIIMAKVLAEWRVELRDVM